MKEDIYIGLLQELIEFCTLQPNRVENISKTVQKYTGDIVHFYWVHDGDKIVAIIKLFVEYNELLLVSIAKDSNHKKKSPYMSDLIKVIYHDNKYHLRSDGQLTEDEFKLWERLYKTHTEVRVKNIKDPLVGCIRLRYEDFISYYKLGNLNKDFAYILM